MLTNSEEMFTTITNIVVNWPERYKKKIILEHIPVWYPDEKTEMVTMYHICATERLFLPKMLPKEDAIIYLDTDVIFMRPPEELWAQFQNFDTKQVASMGSYMNIYAKYLDRGKVRVEAL